MSPINWQQVPGYFDFDDLYEAAVARSPSSGSNFVEVGVLFGRSTLYMADAIRKSGKNIAFEGVDPFEYSPEASVKVIDQYASIFPKNDLSLVSYLRGVASWGGQLAVAVDVLQESNLAKYVRLSREVGQAHAKRCADQCLDFVFIDALHTYEDTKELIQAYLPKMRRGGMIAGHDYTEEYPGLVKAVQETLGNVPRQRSSFAWTKP